MLISALPLFGVILGKLFQSSGSPNPPLLEVGAEEAASRFFRSFMIPIIGYFISRVLPGRSYGPFRSTQMIALRQRQGCKIKQANNHPRLVP